MPSLSKIDKAEMIFYRIVYCFTALYLHLAQLTIHNFKQWHNAILTGKYLHPAQMINQKQVLLKIRFKKL